MTAETAPQRKPRAFAVTGTKAAAKKPQAHKDETRPPRKPRAVDADGRKTILTPLPDEAVDPAYAALAEAEAANGDIQALEAFEPAQATARPKRRFGWGRLALSALSLILGLAATLMIDAFIRDLFSRNDWLGYAGLALAGLLVLGVVGVLARELSGLWRLSTIDHLRQSAERARMDNDLGRARTVSREVGALFAGRPETARGRALLAEHGDDIMDGKDAIELVERDLLLPLDRAARAMVAGSAKRVSVVTAVSPRALVDLGFVLFENIRLIRRIGEHYGGKPGLLGSLRLIRHVVFHLGATGAIAAGDGLIQQLIGHGLAARLSARLGEGVVNGLLTARVGIAAMDVCRPVPFSDGRRPRIADFIGELTRLQGEAEAK
ncbi:MAG: TIGR01620 family protein [Nitratireductor sp.]|nr:TIGR01620 family protein [Nitratireductor sp.]